MERVRASSDQFAKLLEFMERNGDLAKPQPGPLGRLRAEHLWAELTIALNSTGGVKRTSDKWKKVWADWKSKTKKKALTRRRHVSGSGGGPSKVNVTSMEERVLRISGSLAVEGRPDVEEQELDSQPTSTHSREGEYVFMIVENELAEPDQPSTSGQLPTPLPSLRPHRSPPPVDEPTRNAEPPPISLSPHSSVSGPRRRLHARRRQRFTFARAANEFLAIEQQRLRLEERRERNDALRIEMEQDRNSVLNRFADIAEAVLQLYTQRKL